MGHSNGTLHFKYDVSATVIKQEKKGSCAQISVERVLTWHLSRSTKVSSILVPGSNPVHFRPDEREVGSTCICFLAFKLFSCTWDEGVSVGLRQQYILAPCEWENGAV